MHRLARFMVAAFLVAGIVAAAGVAGVTTGAPPARAAVGSSCTGYNVGGNAWAVQCGNGGGSGNGGGGGGTSVCTYYTLGQAVKMYLVSAVVAAQYKAPPGYIYLVQDCPDQWFGTAIILFADGGKLTAQDLASQAYAELSPPALSVGTAPPSGRDGLVGLPEWFWIDAADYLTLSRTVALGGLSATVTARPGPLVINPGDGQPSFACQGPGTPYNTSEPASSQHSTCTFLYTQPSAGQPGNAFTVTISVTWTATWSGTGGTGGTLAPITRTTTIALPIAQAETVYSGG